MLNAASRCLLSLQPLTLAAAVLLLASSSAPPPAARYFPETGHSVRDPFLSFFEAHGGLDLFGYPITEPFEQDGRMVQFFQRARLELHPENPSRYLVEPTLLGDLLGRRTPPLPASRVPASAAPQQRYYGETGHSISFAFLKFFDEHGSIDTLGYPINEPFVEEGLLVQDFQRARLIWQPRYPPGNRVQVAPLGEVYFQRRGMDPALLAPVPPPDNAPATPTIPCNRSQAHLHVEVGVAQYSVQAGQAQTIRVHVRDSAGYNVENAWGMLTLRLPVGVKTLPLPPTDEMGLSHLLFDPLSRTPGTLVLVEVVVDRGGEASVAHTAFLIR
jgi:hypothetical protein